MHAYGTGKVVSVNRVIIFLNSYSHSRVSKRPILKLIPLRSLEYSIISNKALTKFQPAVTSSPPAKHRLVITVCLEAILSVKSILTPFYFSLIISFTPLRYQMCLTNVH